MTDFVPKKAWGLREVRIEMGCVYNAVRTGEMEIGLATKLIFVLSSMAKAIELHNKFWHEERESLSDIQDPSCLSSQQNQLSGKL